LFVAFLQSAVLAAVVDAIEGVSLKASFVNKVPKFGSVAVDEFGSEFENLICFAEGADTSTDAVACFKDEHLAPGFGEAARSCEPGHAGTDDQNTLFSGIHHRIGCGPGMEVVGNWVTRGCEMSSNPTAATP